MGDSWDYTDHFHWGKNTYTALWSWRSACVCSFWSWLPLQPLTSTRSAINVVFVAHTVIPLLNERVSLWMKTKVSICCCCERQDVPPNTSLNSSTGWLLMISKTRHSTLLRRRLCQDLSASQVLFWKFSYFLFYFVCTDAPLVSGVLSSFSSCAPSSRWSPVSTLMCLTSPVSHCLLLPGVYSLCHSLHSLPVVLFASQAFAPCLSLGYTHLCSTSEFLIIVFLPSLVLSCGRFCRVIISFYTYGLFLSDSWLFLYLWTFPVTFSSVFFSHRSLLRVPESPYNKRQYFCILGFCLASVSSLPQRPDNLKANLHGSALL